jgi:hypothetical protein
MGKYEIGSDIEYKGKKCKILQIVHQLDKTVSYLVRFEDGLEMQVSLE